MPTNVVLTGTGRDRVGIVAELSNILYQLGCNLLDSSMTLLRGEFAVILMAQIPDNSSIDELRKKLTEVEESLKMNVYVRELTDEELIYPDDDGLPAYIISVYGADQPGIVAGITSELARLKVNLTDVETTKTDNVDDEKDSIFLMLLEVTLPKEVSSKKLKADLNKKAKELNVDLSISEVDYMEI